MIEEYDNRFGSLIYKFVLLCVFRETLGTRAVFKLDNKASLVESKMLVPLFFLKNAKYENIVRLQKTIITKSPHGI